MPKISGLLMGTVAIVIGILILVAPGVMQWILGIGLIVMGLLAILRK